MSLPALWDVAICRAMRGLVATVSHWMLQSASTQQGSLYHSQWPMICLTSQVALGFVLRHALIRPCGACLPCPGLHVALMQAWEELQAGTGYSSETGMQLSDMSNYLITKGLGHLPKPMWWLNGLLDEIPEGGHSTVDQTVGFKLMHEMQALQEHIYYGRMDDEQTVVESMLEMHQSVRRWNPRVLAVGDSADADTQKVRITHIAHNSNTIHNPTKLPLGTNHVPLHCAWCPAACSCECCEASWRPGPDLPALQGHRGTCQAGHPLGHHRPLKPQASSLL